MKMEKMFEFLKPDFENIDDRGELKQLYSKRGHLGEITIIK